MSDRSDIVTAARAEIAKADANQGSEPWAVRALLDTIDALDADLAAARAETRRVVREDGKVVSRMRKRLERAVYVATNLHAMIDRETWRASAGDDGQGHYEGDYHAEKTLAEIQGWLTAAGPDLVEPYVVSDERLAEKRSVVTDADLCPMCGKVAPGVPVCVVPGCGEVAEYDLWGRLFPLQGPHCHDHAYEQLGCLCAKCVAQSAVRKLPLRTAA